MTENETVIQDKHYAILATCASLQKEPNDVLVGCVSIPGEWKQELQEIRKRVFGSTIIKDLHLRPGVYDSMLAALRKEGNFICDNDTPVEYEQAKDWRDATRGMRRMSVNMLAEDCPLCMKAEYTSDVTICSTNGFVLRKGNEGLPQTDLKWEDVRYACPSVGWHYSSRQFKGFGRMLTLLDPDIKPEHNLAENEIMYLSELVSRLRSVLMEHHPKRLFTERPTTGTVAAKVRKDKDNYKSIQVLPVSKYVGIAVVQPLNGVHRKRKRVTKFWDWRFHELGTPNEVVARREGTWKGVCAYCLLQLTRNRSITGALVRMGEPDPVLRLHSDYLDDLIEVAVDAESCKRLTVYAVEPVTDNYIEQLFRGGFNV